jgi:CheY-like chemotaxis protein
MIRAMIVDDDALVRLGLADLLDDDPGIEVVAQAPDGLKAIEQATASTSPSSTSACPAWTASPPPPGCEPCPTPRR